MQVLRGLPDEERVSRQREGAEPGFHQCPLSVKGDSSPGLSMGAGAGTSSWLAGVTRLFALFSNNPNSLPSEASPDRKSHRP